MAAHLTTVKSHSHRAEDTAVEVVTFSLTRHQLDRMVSGTCWSVMSMGFVLHLILVSDKYRWPA